MRRWFGIFSLCSLLLISCTKTQQVKEDKPAPTQETNPDDLNKKLGLPDGLETIVFPKKGFFQAFLHPNGLLKADAPQNKKDDWSKDYLRPKQTLTWFARLRPEAGAKIGSYISNFVVMATYNDPAGFQQSAIVLLQAGILRDGKEQLFFQSLQKPRGQNYARYDQPNREINADITLQKDDLIFFRTIHRKGPAGAVAYGGGLGSASSQFVISHEELGSKYIQYTP
ncbi:hypothetical protein L6R29_13550 [Myxococcota bacterium]|nr:hypothetical protein [Myxococcota bacterium]